jgi:hypothetical protein
MKSNKTFFALLALVVISRVPLFFGGYGADGDGWRVAKTALMLWNEHVYHVSRFPGFPVYEFIQTPIIALGGSIGSNVSSLFIFLLSLILFRRLIQHWNTPNGDLVLLAYAFLPILWKNSALTMDYVWGVCGIIASVYLILTKRFLLAGIVLGLAAGTRVSHIAYLLPLLFLFQRGERNRWFRFSAAAIITTILCYVPVLCSENYLLVVKDYIADERHYSVLRKIGFYFYRLLYSIGLLGWLGAAAVVIINRVQGSLQLRKHSFTFAAFFVLTGLIVFAILPDEREYLMPIFPFLLMILAYIASRIQYVAVTILLISYGFISIDVIEHDIAHPQPGLNLQRGYLVKEFLERREINERRIHLAQIQVPDSSFVMIGMGPLFWLENPYVNVNRRREIEFRHDCAQSLQRKEVYFIYALYKPQLEEIRRRGYNVYYWDEMKEYLETFLDYRLEEEKIPPLHTDKTFLR